jgi:hypothetical protein
MPIALDTSVIAGGMKTPDIVVTWLVAPIY